MASFSEYQSKLDKKYKKEEEQKKSQSTSTSTGGGGTSSSTNRYKDVSSRLDEKYLISSLDGNGVGNWFDEAQSIVSSLQNSKHSEYTTYGKADTEKIQSLLDSSDEVRKYIHANKSAFQNYEDMYNGFTQLKSALSTAKKAQKYYSQFESEDDYNKASMGWLSDDAEFTPESVSKRKSQYQSNLDRIAEIEAQLAAGAEPSDDDKPWWEKILGYLGGVQDTTLPMSTSNVKPSEKDSALLTERDSLKAENLQYERLQKALDDYYSPVTPHFAANAAYRDYANPTKEDLWNYDMSALEGSDVLTRGGYFDEEGNIRNSDGNIVQYANAPTIEDKLGMFLSASDEELTEAYNRLSVTNGNYTDTWANLMQEGDVNGWEHLKEEEINTYYNLLKTRGQAEAYKFLEAMTPTLTRRATQANTDYINNEASLLEMIALNVASVPMNVFGGVAGLVDDVSNIVQGKDIDPYSRAHSLTNMAGDVRNKTAESIDEWTGGAAIPWVDFSFGDAYQAGMSFADSALAMATGTWVGEGLLATGTATSEMRDLYERGATADQMIAGGILAGAAEAVFEHISIGELKKLKNMDNKAVKNLFDGFVRTTIMGGVEASEEMATEIANAISDALVMGSQSDWVDTETFLKNVVNAGIGGFLSGGIGGAIASKVNNAQYNQKVAQHGQAIIDEGGTDALWQLALEMSGDKSALDAKKLGKLAGKVDSKASAKNVGRLSVQMESTISKQNTADIQTALIESGVSEKVAARIADSIGTNGIAGLMAEMQKLDLADMTRVEHVIGKVSDPTSSVILRKQRLEAAEQGVYSPDAAPKEASPEVLKGEHKVSESGKTLYKNENGEYEEVKNLKIVSTDGDVKVELDNGKTVSAKDLELSTDAEAMAFEIVTRMETTPETAQVIFEAVKASDATSAQALFIDVPTAYRYGKINYEAGLKGLRIPDAIKKLAFDQGRKDAAISPNGKKQVVKKQTNNANATQGKVIFEGFEYSDNKATDMQKASMAGINLLAKMSSLEIHVYASWVEGGERYAMVGGKKRKAPNGWHEEGTNKIYLDINAGNKGEGAMLYTLGHEATHYIANWNWDGFKKLGDFLIENFGKNDVPVDILIERKKQTLIKSYQRDGKAVPGENQLFKEAYEEVVAEAMTSMFADPKAYEKLAELKKQDKTLWQKLGEAIKKLLDKLKSLLGVYDNTKSGAREADFVAQFSKDVYDKLQDLYLKAFVEADANYQAAKKDGTADKQFKKRVNDAHRGIHYSFSAYTDKQKENWKNAKRIVLYENEAQFRDFISKARHDTDFDKKLYFGAIPSDLAELIKADTGINVENFNCSLSAYEIRKIFKDHGNEAKKSLRGQRAITEDDIVDIPTVIQSPGKIELSAKKYEGKPAIEFSKQTNGTLTVVAVVSDKHLDLFVQTAYVGIKKGNLSTPTGEQAPINTPEANNGTVSEDSIPQDSDSVKRNFLEREIVDISNNDYVKMYHHFGSTKNYDVAGYMLGNGVMLDFSGKHWGDDYSTSRQVDHRDVQEVLDDRGNNGINAMIDMIGNGNIRLMPEVGGINLAVKPNSTQMSQLRGYINHFRGEVVVDIDKVGGDTIHSFEYTKGTSSSKILSDIKAYFDEGVVPEQKAKDETDIRQFRYYERDSSYMDAVKRGDRETAQRMVDEAAKKAGYTVKAYHGTNGKFTVFKPGEKNGWLGKGIYFAESRKYAKENGKKVITAYLNPHNLYASESNYHFGVFSELTEKFPQMNESNIAEVLKSEGYEGISYTDWDKGKIFSVFSSEQIKSADPVTYDDNGDVIPLSQRFNAENKDIRYQERSTSVEQDPYSYEALVSKPDMKITTVSSNVPTNRADVVAQAKKNAAKVGKFNSKDGSVSVRVEDVGADVVLSTGGLRHGLDRRFDVNAPVTVKAGDILKNSIKINQMIPKNETAESSYILIGAAKNEKGELYVVRSVVNRFKSELVSMDTLYAINAKTEPNLGTKKGNQAGAYPQGTLSNDSFLTDSTISIAQLFDFVNRYFSDILPESVLRHYGHDARPNGDLGERVLYQERDPDSISPRSLLANALESTVQNDIERNKLAQYKSKLAHVESEQAKLADVRQQAHDLRFKKGRTEEETKKLRGLDFEANQIANRINTYDRQLFALEATAALKGVLEREKQMSYKRAEQKGKEALKKQRERASENYKKLLAEKQESRKNAIESRHKTEMRHKIKKVVSDLDHLLRHGSKERNVKLGLQSAVASALEAVNMDTVAADERIAKLKADLMKAKTPEKIQEISRKIDNIQSQGDRMASRLEELRRAYADIRASDDEGITEYYKHEASIIADKVDSVMTKVGNTPLRNMSLSQLEAVYELYQVVLTTVRGANEAFVEGKIEDLHKNVSEIMTEVSSLPALKEERLAIGEKASGIMWNELIPVTAFDRIGSKTFTRFFWELVRGQNTFANDVKEAKEFSSSAREKYGYSKWDLDKVHEFKLTDGRTFRVTLKHMMSIYAYSKREQALDHMRVGGFFFNDKETFRKEKGVLKVIKSNEEGYYIDDLVLEAIKGEMSKEQLLYVDEMQDYLTKMGTKGNEVSRVLWGIDIFKEKVYFPLKSSKDFVFQANQTAQETSLKNDGMTKETKPGASNPIVLEAFDDVWATHVNRMSQYHSFVIPIENVNKILNYGTWAGTASVSVSTMLKSRHGAAAIEYLTNFVKDLNGASAMHGASNPLFSLVGRFKKTAVAASLSVVVQQPTAVLRSMAVMDAKYIAHMPALRHLASKWEELQKYAPIAIIKDIGGFDAGAGRQATEWLNEDTRRGLDKAMGKIDDITMAGAAWGDKVGWCTIWESVKREIKATTPLKEGSEEFLKKAGERFTEIIVRTQVYDSTLSRSGYMRSKHESVKMMTAFMGEPTVSINMMLDAFTQAKRKTITKRHAGKIIGSVYASTLAAAIAASLIYALRDDDEDEAYLEKFAESLGGKIVDDLNLLNMLPIFRDINSIMDGWDVERTDMAIFKDIKDAFDGLNSENKSAWKKVEDFAGAIGNAFGVPVKNLLRTGREVYNLFENFFDGVNPTWEGFGGALTGKKPDKDKSLYDAIISGDEARLAILRKSYKDDSAYETAVKKALRENDPRIKEAAQADFDGDIEAYNRIINEIIGEGNFDKADILAAFKTERNNLEPDDEEEDSNAPDKDVSIYNVEHYFTAIKSGNTSLANVAKDDIIKIAVANGKSLEDAESAFYRSFRDRAKEAYAEGDLTRSEAERMLVNHGNLDEDDAYWTLKEWDYLKQNGTLDGYSKYNNFYEAVRTGKNLKAVISEHTSHGDEAKTLASRITTYFKPLYKEMSNPERSEIKGYLLNAYVQLGYSRVEKNKDINAWLKEKD